MYVMLNPRLITVEMLPVAMETLARTMCTWPFSPPPEGPGYAAIY